MRKNLPIHSQKIIDKIFFIRGEKVMLDVHLAELYKVETRVLKQAVKRNMKRFPDDFIFKLNQKEIRSVVSQNVIPHKKCLGGALPFAFTEQGIAMLSSILHSTVAINVNIQIIRVFTQMRKFMLTQKDILLKLENIEKRIMRHDVISKKLEEDIMSIFDTLNKLIWGKAHRKKIGYKS